MGRGGREFLLGRVLRAGRDPVSLCCGRVRTGRAWWLKGEGGGAPGQLWLLVAGRVVLTAYQGSGPAIRVPLRRRRLDPDTGQYRPLSVAQKQVNAAHARQRGPGERANAQLKSWVLGLIRSCPGQATDLVKAVLVLIQTS
jgi:hypothetical protein